MSEKSSSKQTITGDQEFGVTKLFAGILVVIFVVTAVGELTIINWSLDNEALSQVNVVDDRPYLNDDIRVGRARLKAELGLMHMDLAELKYFFQNNVTGKYDIYQYQSWKLPSLFVSEKGGDCEDYVLFALAVLSHTQYRLKPILGTFLGDGHAFLLVQEGSDVTLLDAMGLQSLEPAAFNDYSRLPDAYTVDSTLDDMLNDRSILGGLL